MSDLPPRPVAPAEFFESFLPRAFEEAELPEDLQSLDVALGVRLEGEGGGEWLFRLEAGRLRVTPGSRQSAAFSVVQTVEDWRGALWEGRGGAIGRQAAAVFRPDSLASPTPGALGEPPSPAALALMQGLDGLIRMVVTGAEGGDWGVAFKLGPGDIPAEATTTIRISAEDAAAMERGELNPIEAFLAGRIQVAGDMTLVMQMQAIQMQAAAARPPKS